MSDEAEIVVTMPRDSPYARAVKGVLAIEPGETKRRSEVEVPEDGTVTVLHHAIENATGGMVNTNEVEVERVRHTPAVVELTLMKAPSLFEELGQPQTMLDGGSR